MSDNEDDVSESGRTTTTTTIARLIGSSGMVDINLHFIHLTTRVSHMAIMTVNIDDDDDSAEFVMEQLRRNGLSLFLVISCVRLARTRSSELWRDATPLSSVSYYKLAFHRK
jgi:hypothetical protein